MPRPDHRHHHGPDHGHASDTRQLAERSRTEPNTRVSGRAFWIAFAVILLAVALFALLLWQT